MKKKKKNAKVWAIRIIAIVLAVLMFGSVFAAAFLSQM